MEKLNEFINDWKDTYVDRILQASGSKKEGFNYKDATRTKYAEYRTSFDDVMIDYLDFMDRKPLKRNDYFKYVNAYDRTGKKLNPKFFRHDKKKLKTYYDRIDAHKSAGTKYHAFNESGYKRYVLYMMLKLSGQYIRADHDEVFNVIFKGHREFNPSTSTSSVLRGVLPFKIKEFDISRAYPTFIFMELGMEPFDVYKSFDKVLYNKLLNTHSGVTSDSIYKLRGKLEPIYGKRVIDVITEDRFYNPGRLYEELTKLEKKYIEKFVKVNDLTNYVRLHDGVITRSGVECDTLVFDDILEFKIKNVNIPTRKNTPVNFYFFQQNETADGEKTKPKIVTTPVSYMNFFQQEGFIRVTKENADRLTVLKSDKKIVTTMNHNTDMASYLKNYINEEDPGPILNQIAKDTSSKTNQGLKLITPTPFEYHKDTSFTVDIPYKNGIARITRENKELLSYDDVEVFFPKHSTQNHTISFTPSSKRLKSPFAQFFIMAALGKDHRKKGLTKADIKLMGSFFSMMGYYISNHKIASCNYTGILTDLGANGIYRDGGRGKSLIQEALSYFRLYAMRGAHEYDPDYRHVHDFITEAHDLLLLDDMPLGFKWDKLYTNTTNGMTVVPKGGTAYWIPFESSVKVLASYNGALRLDPKNKSSTRRFMEFKISDFWQDKNPGAYFGGGDFFTTWNDDEWNDFYNFGFFCVQYFLKNGLQVISYDKKMDNFLAYFGNDVVEDETKRIFKYFNDRDRDSFSATDFIDVHKKKYQYDKPIFHQNNTKKLLNIYIQFKNLPYRYDEHNSRKWIKTSKKKEKKLF